jgi:hypothetical protein
MSLGVVIKGTEGVVLAADSRVTLEARSRNLPPIPVNFDNASKLLTFSKPHDYVAAVTYGVAVIGRRTAYSFIPEFETKLAAKNERLKIEDYAQELSKFFIELWGKNMPPNYQGPAMVFIVAGYDPGEPYSRVFLFEIPNRADPQPRNPGEKDFGMTWGGQLQIASRLIHGFDPELPSIVKNVLKLSDGQVEELNRQLQPILGYPIPYDVLPLQDCIDLAIFLIRSTMVLQNLAIGVRGVGGPIDVGVITRTEPFTFIQKKKMHGEQSVEGGRS